MKKLIIIIVFVVLYLLVGFFGLGPVLLADGSNQERLLTLSIVVLIFIVLTIILIKLLKRVS